MRPILNFFIPGLGKGLKGKAEHILRLPSCIFFYCWGLPTAGAEGYCSRKASHWRQVGTEDRRIGDIIERMAGWINVIQTLPAMGNGGTQHNKWWEG